MRWRFWEKGTFRLAGRDPALLWRSAVCYVFGHRRWLMPTRLGRSLGCEPARLLRCGRCDVPLSVRAPLPLTVAPEKLPALHGFACSNGCPGAPMLLAEWVKYAGDVGAIQVSVICSGCRGSYVSKGVPRLLR